MLSMLQYAESQTVTVNTAPATTTQLDFGAVLVALGLAAEPAAEPAAEVTIEFDEDECQAFEVERNGIIVRFMKNRQVDCIVTDYRGSHRISARMTRVFFVNQNGGLIGETAVLPIVQTQAVADMLVWRGGVMPNGDTVTVL